MRQVTVYPTGEIINIDDITFYDLVKQGTVVFDDEWTEETPNGQYGINEDDVKDWMLRPKDYTEEQNKLR